MKQNQLKSCFSILTFLLSMHLLLISCENDEKIFQNIEVNNVPVIKTTSFNKANKSLKEMTKELRIEKNMISSNKQITPYKSTQSSNGLILDTTIVKEVTLGDYKSYTMRIVDDDSLVFYNLTMEEKNGETSMFITRYEPTQQWINNQSQSFDGITTTSPINTLSVYTEPADAFGNDFGGGTGSSLGNIDLGPGVGGIGGADYFTTGPSPIFPTDCSGVVITTMESVPYPCGCGHWPWDNCNVCEYGEPVPGYQEIPHYICQTFWEGDPTHPTNPGSGSGGTGSSNDNPNDNPSIAATITPEDELPQKPKTECQSLKQLVANDSLGSNILPIVNQLRAKLGADENEWSISYENVWSEYGRKNVPDTEDGIREGTSRTRSKAKTGNTWVGQIHTHPLNTYKVFSWLDLRALRNIYEDVNNHFKQDVFLMVVAPNNETYAMKVNDIAALISKIDADWTNAEGADDEAKEKFIERIMVDKYSISSNQEQAFLELYGDYGISFYKATDANLSNWKQIDLLYDIEIDENNNQTITTSIFEINCN